MKTQNVVNGVRAAQMLIVSLADAQKEQPLSKEEYLETLDLVEETILASDADLRVLMAPYGDPRGHAA